MKLTDKAKELFEKWYLKLIRENRRDYDKFSDEVILRKFYRLLPSQQWGVYQDFADSLGYLIEILVVPIENTLYRFEFDFTIYNQNEQIEIGELGCETRQEARNAAIGKLNEIINQKQIR